MKVALKSKFAVTSDLIAGLSASIPALPDARASAVWAAINPIYGIYAYCGVMATYANARSKFILTKSTRLITQRRLRCLTVMNWAPF